jgi:hypothetical protein
MLRGHVKMKFMSSWNRWGHETPEDLDVSSGSILVIEETRIRIRRPSYED